MADASLMAVTAVYVARQSTVL